jgi:hypothetical protein
MNGLLTVNIIPGYSNTQGAIGRDEVGDLSSPVRRQRKDTFHIG